MVRESCWDRFLDTITVCVDWDETEPREIADESASMPHGWLESEEAMIADPDAVKPADW